MKKNYNKIINQIQKVRSKNNVNWMNLLKLAFELDPKKASEIMKKVNYDDKRVSDLVKKLSLQINIEYSLSDPEVYFYQNIYVINF